MNVPMQAGSGLSRVGAAVIGGVVGGATELSHVVFLADQPLAERSNFLKLMTREAVQSGAVATTTGALLTKGHARHLAVAAGAGFQAGVLVTRPLAERLIPIVARDTPIHGPQAAGFIRSIMAKHPLVVRTAEFALGGGITGATMGAVATSGGPLQRTVGALKGGAVGAAAASGARVTGEVVMDHVVAPPLARALTRWLQGGSS